MVNHTVCVNWHWKFLDRDIRKNGYKCFWNPHYGLTNFSAGRNIGVSRWMDIDGNSVCANGDCRICANGKKSGAFKKMPKRKRKTGRANAGHQTQRLDVCRWICVGWSSIPLWLVATSEMGVLCCCITLFPDFEEFMHSLTGWR